jgi:hypothetical protein
MKGAVTVNFGAHGANKRFHYKSKQQKDAAVQAAVVYVWELMGPDWNPWQNISVPDDNKVETQSAQLQVAFA